MIKKVTLFLVISAKVMSIYEAPLSEIDFKKNYTIGVKIPNNSHAGEDFNPLHMSIAYLGYINPYKLREIKKIIKNLENTGVELIIDKHALLGEKSNVLVRKLKINDPTVKDNFKQIYDKFGRKERWMKEKPKEQDFHMSLRTDKLKEEFKDPEIMGTTIKGYEIFIKPLGNNPSIFTMDI